MSYAHTVLHRFIFCRNTMSQIHYKYEFLAIFILALNVMQEVFYKYLHIFEQPNRNIILESELKSTQINK
jgi:hypothetical protein